MEEPLTAQCGVSAFNLARLVLALLGCVLGPQMTAQTHIQGDCNAHYDQRTYTQDQEPPDHPHSRLE